MYLIPFITNVFAAVLRWSNSTIQISKNEFRYLFLFIYFLLLAEECWTFFSRILFFMQSRMVAQLESLYERRSLHFL